MRTHNILLYSIVLLLLMSGTAYAKKSALYQTESYIPHTFMVHILKNGIADCITLNDQQIEAGSCRSDRPIFYHTLPPNVDRGGFSQSLVPPGKNILPTRKAVLHQKQPNNEDNEEQPKEKGDDTEDKTDSESLYEEGLPPKPAYKHPNKGQANRAWKQMKSDLIKLKSGKARKAKEHFAVEFIQANRKLFEKGQIKKFKMVGAYENGDVNRSRILVEFLWKGEPIMHQYIIFTLEFSSFGFMVTQATFYEPFQQEKKNP